MTDIFGDTTRAELQREIDRLRAEIAALKANDPLAEMWAALAEYQPMADRDGHGESWAKMCQNRTARAAWEACRARPAVFDDATDGAKFAWDAISFQRESMMYADRSIAAIRRAKEAQP
jgi:hypothetical protein